MSNILNKLKNLSALNKINGFKLFGLEEKFSIDTSKLQSTMHDLQRQLHPDKFIKEDSEIQKQSTDLSSLVNEYYKKIENPYSRSKYLLSLKLNVTQEYIDSKLDNMTIDQEFLMRMLEFRETDGTQESTEQLQSELDELYQSIKDSFESARYDEVFAKLGKVKFLTRALNERKT